MDKTIMELEEIKEMKKKLSNWVKEELECGKDYVACHYEKIGEIVDMIKDLAEVEKECMEAKYYETVTKAMEDYEHDEMEEKEGPYGYDNWRYASGRYAPTGHGHYDKAGYTPFKGNVRVHDPNMNGIFKMGYHDQDSHTGKGKTYDEFDDARRHYSETGKAEDLRDMNDKLGKHLSNTIEQLREMAEVANPDMQKKLKKEISTLMNDINSMV